MGLQNDFSILSLFKIFRKPVLISKTLSVGEFLKKKYIFCRENNAQESQKVKERKLYVEKIEHTQRLQDGRKPEWNVNTYPLECRCLHFFEKRFGTLTCAFINQSNLICFTTTWFSEFLKIVTELFLRLRIHS